VPLAEVYDGKSPLEHLHCTLLMHSLRQHGFSSLLDTPQRYSFRKLLHETVLATDMSVHAKFMTDFRRLVDGQEMTLWDKRVLVCQAIIKWADISNPVYSLCFSRCCLLTTGISVDLFPSRNIGLLPSRRSGRLRQG